MKEILHGECEEGNTRRGKKSMKSAAEREKKKKNPGEEEGAKGNKKEKEKTYMDLTQERIKGCV